MKDISILDENSRPFSRTYYRRASNLVKKGRARWVNNAAIEILPSLPSEETEDVNEMTDEKITISIPSYQPCEGGEVQAPIDAFIDDETTHWVEYFKSLAEKLTESEDLARFAIDSIRQTTAGPGPDRPGEGIARVFEAHMRSRSELYKGLMEFVNIRKLK